MLTVQVMTYERLYARAGTGTPILKLNGLKD